MCLFLAIALPTLKPGSGLADVVCLFWIERLHLDQVAREQILAIFGRCRCPEKAVGQHSDRCALVLKGAEHRALVDAAGTARNYRKALVRCGSGKAR